ncbi:MAG: cytochrome-c oxidase [Alphaproteobacteria bacterium]|uniref:hypothetical protein n=1 Tax=Pacificispira sp. TaxID=2888761 RepID=UPI002968F105|nr:cytochrome-c oxidase [Alphaproteobacteria bacterium]
MKYLAILGLLVAVMPAFAHHPGERLDEVMANKEPAFEPTDTRSMPDLALTDEQGARLTFRDLRESIVVLSFVPRDCGAPCVEQQDNLASVQEQVNITPMKQMVTFLTIRDRKTSNGAPWDNANWRSVAPQDEVVAESARRFATLSDRNPSSPLVHVIDRGSRHAGLFHGTEFQQINLVRYINGLTNAPPAGDEPEPDTWWNSLMGVFK